MGGSGKVSASLFGKVPRGSVVTVTEGMVEPQDKTGGSDFGYDFGPRASHWGVIFMILLHALGVDFHYIT